MERNKPLVSVVMPAYNAAKFLARAIDSVLAQTYPNIELVIADDASTDNTCAIVEQYKDDRIKLIKDKVNSGSAYMPRYRAYLFSSAEYVLNLDSDDYLEPTYIERLMSRLEACQADVCCGVMVPVDEEEKLLGEKFCIPKPNFDFNCQLTGKEAFFHTTPGWDISMNGCLARREIMEKGYVRTYKLEKHGIHDDENVSRYILLYSDKVVFSEARLFYTVNRASVTHIFNERIFDFMYGIGDLLQYIGEDFGRESREYQAIEGTDYTAFCCVRYDFLNNLDHLSDKELIFYLKKMKAWHERLNWQSIGKYINKTREMIERNFLGSMGLIMLKYKQFKPLKNLTLIYIGRFFDRVRNNKYYRWHIYRIKREKMIRCQIEIQYKAHGGKYCPCVISIFDGTVHSGGLADRLRGIISVYAVCKRMGIPYRLHFTYPFELSQFLEPNEYDWRIAPQEISHDLSQTKIVILDATEDSTYQFAKQGKYLQKHLQETNKQVHVFTNAGYAYTLNYAKLFNELFRPTPRLAKSLTREQKKLGKGYISVSARFLDLLGDFNETFGYGHILPEKEAQILIERALAEIEKIHQKSPNRAVLVNSDSTRFLRAANKLSYTYVAPGEVTHIDNEQNDDSYERYEKTFLDFLLIANASEIVLLRNGRMHRSGYPYAASLLYGRPFREVNF